MAKRLLLLHVGPGPVDVVAMTDALTLGRIALPEVDPEVLDHAGIEIRRTHKAAGLKRKQVEGAWSRLCRRARKTRSDCFVSLPDLFEATPEQAALAVDGLADFRVVLVVTSGFIAPPSAWTGLVTGERTHVLPSHLAPEQLAAQVARIALMEEEARLDRRLAKVTRRRRMLSTGGQPPDATRQCGCQASSSSVRAATACGSEPSASCWMVTCTKTIRSEWRAAIHTCCRTSALSPYSTASGRRP